MISAVTEAQEMVMMAEEMTIGNLCCLLSGLSNNSDSILCQILNCPAREFWGLQVKGFWNVGLVSYSALGGE